VHNIASLARGQTATEIINDHPTLTAALPEEAVDVAKICPGRGRKQTRSFERMIVCSQPKR
jgi:hypothetical protein